MSLGTYVYNKKSNGMFVISLFLFFFSQTYNYNNILWWLLLQLWIFLTLLLLQNCCFELLKFMLDPYQVYKNWMLIISNIELMCNF